jgi:hypothetical protein
MNEFTSSDKKLKVCYEENEKIGNGLNGSTAKRTYLGDETLYEMLTQKIHQTNEICIDYCASSKQFYSSSSGFCISGSPEKPYIEFIYPISIRNGKFNSEGTEIQELGDALGIYDEEKHTYQIEILSPSKSYSFNISVNGAVVTYEFEDKSGKDKINLQNSFNITSEIVTEIDEETGEEYQFAEYSFVGKHYLIYRQCLNDGTEYLFDGFSEKLLSFSDDGIIYNAKDKPIDFPYTSLYEGYIGQYIRYIENAFKTFPENFPEVPAELFELDYLISKEGYDHLTFSQETPLTLPKILEKIKHSESR